MQHSIRSMGLILGCFFFLGASAQARWSGHRYECVSTLEYRALDARGLLTTHQVPLKISGAMSRYGDVLQGGLFVAVGHRSAFFAQPLGHAHPSLVDIEVYSNTGEGISLKWFGPYATNNWARYRAPDGRGAWVEASNEVWGSPGMAYPVHCRVY